MRVLTVVYHCPRSVTPHLRRSNMSVYTASRHHVIQALTVEVSAFSWSDRQSCPPCTSVINHSKSFFGIFDVQTVDMVRVDLYATSVGLPSSWRNNFQRHPARTVGQQRYPHLDSFLTLKLQNERADFRCNVAAEPTGSRAHLTRCVNETGDNEYRTAARTDFVAETLLPTQQGKFRLRGYRHTVCEG